MRRLKTLSLTGHLQRGEDGLKENEANSTYILYYRTPWIPHPMGSEPAAILSLPLFTFGGPCSARRIDLAVQEYYWSSYIGPTEFLQQAAPHFPNQLYRRGGGNRIIKHSWEFLLSFIKRHRLCTENKSHLDIPLLLIIDISFLISTSSHPLPHPILRTPF